MQLTRTLKLILSITSLLTLLQVEVTLAAIIPLSQTPNPNPISAHNTILGRVQSFREIHGLGAPTCYLGPDQPCPFDPCVDYTAKFFENIYVDCVRIEVCTYETFAQTCRVKNTAVETCPQSVKGVWKVIARKTGLRMEEVRRRWREMERLAREVPPRGWWDVCPSGELKMDEVFGKKGGVRLE